MDPRDTLRLLPAGALAGRCLVSPGLGCVAVGIFVIGLRDLAEVRWGGLPRREALGCLATGAAGQTGNIVLVPRLFLQALLDNHRRLFLQPAAALLRDGDGRRPHHLPGRSPLRRQQTRH